MAEPKGEGFAFFRWASLVTPGLTYYPGLLVHHVWSRDWGIQQLRGAIYGR